MRGIKKIMVVVLGLAASTAALALDDSHRGYRGEATFRFSNLQGDSYSSAEGSTAKTDNGVGYGFGFGYNVDENLELSGNFSWASVDYSANNVSLNGGASRSFRGEMDTSTISFNATYNILRKTFTPFVSVGVGSTYIDSNIPNGPPSSSCWYDPWYGYYCSSYVPTKHDTNFSYNVAGGLRWDVNESFFMKAAVNELWMDGNGSIGRPGFVSYSLDFGYMFN